MRTNILTLASGLSDHELLARLGVLAANEREATVELVQFEEETGTAVLRVEGECPDCEMSAANLIEGIGAHLRARVPEVKDVRRIEIRATP